MKNSNLKDKILSFRKERDWEKFHSIKDLCLGIGIEVAELQEIFLWKTTDQINKIIDEDKNKIANELADIFIFLTYISSDLNIDLEKAISDKIQLNEDKYPLSKSKGNNKKYTEL
jgi:NTP pyrophosphatase (non-canonical NTP hydrolase)